MRSSAREQVDQAQQRVSTLARRRDTIEAELRGLKGVIEALAVSGSGVPAGLADLEPRTTPRRRGPRTWPPRRRGWTAPTMTATITPTGRTTTRPPCSTCRHDDRLRDDEQQHHDEHDRHEQHANGAAAVQDEHEIPLTDQHLHHQRTT